MKIGVIVPSIEYLAQAGVRIRYRRIQPHVEALGHEIMLAVIGDIDPGAGLACDAYLFSKCYDAAAPLLAATIRAHGKLVGIDIFDDMFSETGDARLVRHRAWLREMAPLADFILCSTPRLREVMAGFAPARPIHILNDPFAMFDADRLAKRIDRKRSEAVESRRIKAAWFGVGDNPTFHVGLSDLSAFAVHLAALKNEGFAIDLRVLTNKRALTEDGLRMLARLPIPLRIDEWTADGETDLLEESLLSFIPVNAQNFSIAKSLNRAVSALTGGTQLLSAGYPLYAPLADFIYRDVRAFAEDLDRDRLKLRGATIEGLRALFDEWGDPAIEVRKLIDFLTGLPLPAAGATNMPAAKVLVLHGRKSASVVQQVARKLDHLSIATPFSSPKMRYDAGFTPAPTAHSIEARFSARAIGRLAPEFLPHLLSDPDGGATLRFASDPMTVSRLRRAVSADLASTTALYPETLNAVAALAERFFPDATILLSEGEAPLDAAFPIKRDSDGAVGRCRVPTRILFVANADIPSLQISFLQPLAPLIAAGAVEVLVITDAQIKQQFQRTKIRIRNAWIAEQLAGFDPNLIVFCRYSGHFSRIYRAYAEANAVPTVFHIDDDLLDVPPEIGEDKYLYHMDRKRIDRVQSLLGSVDLIYASTRELERRMRLRFPDRHIATGRIYCSGEVRRLPSESAAGKVGYMGGSDHAHDLQMAVPAIVAVMDKYPALRFELFGAIPIPDDLLRFGDRVTSIPPIANYAEFLQHFSEMDWDVGICPLASSDFNAGKANTKWVEYSTVGIAVVASAGFAYDDCCSDGAGMLARSIEDWTAALDRLIGDDEQRYRQVVIAQEKLRRDYSMFELRRQLSDIIDPLLAAPLPQIDAGVTQSVAAAA